LDGTGVLVWLGATVALGFAVSVAGRVGAVVRVGVEDGVAALHAGKSPTANIIKIKRNKRGFIFWSLVFAGYSTKILAD
jgi:hypothetical protein